MGKLIVIEGTDNSGKSTLAKQLIEDLGDAYYFEELEPYGEIRDILNNPCFYKDKLGLVDDFQFGVFLTKKFMENRIQYQEKLESLLNKYNYVIIDRYVISTLLYGTFEDKKEWYDHKNKVLSPDLTIILSPNNETIKKRVIESGEDDYYQNADKAVDYNNKFLEYYNLKRKTDNKLKFINPDILGLKDVKELSKHIIENHIKVLDE